MNFSFGANPEFALQNKIKIQNKNNPFYFENNFVKLQLKPSNTIFELIENIKNSLKSIKEFIQPNKIDVKQLAKGNICLGLPKFLVNKNHAIKIVRMLDLFVLFPFIKKNKTNKLESYEIKNYGLEYKSLNNFWLNSPELTSTIYDLCGFVLSFVEKGNYERFWENNVCFGYDINLLKNCIEKSTIDKKLMIFVQNFLPDYLNKKLEKIIDLNYFDIFDEWNI